MRRLFPVLLSGMMAVSFSQLAGAQKVDVQGPAGTGANADLNKGGSTTVAPDVQNSQQIGGSNQSNQQQGKGYGKHRNKDKDASSSDPSASAGANAGSSKETGDTQNRHDSNPADKAPKY